MLLTSLKPRRSIEKYSNHLNTEHLIHLNTGLFSVRFSNGLHKNGNSQHNNGNHAT